MEGSITPLATILHNIIRTEGAISLERYMEIALHHPEYGYYRQGNPLGLDGDFLTAPDISPIFGEMIGVWCFNAWQRIGKPSAFILLELGPGQGTLLQSALVFTQGLQAFHKAMALYLVESNVTLKSIQKEKLSRYNPIYAEKIDDLPSLPMIVVANEFFDTLPMRQFVRGFFGWRERLVALKNGAFYFMLGKRTKIPPQFPLNPFIEKVQKGWTLEVSPQAHEIMGSLTSHIASCCGAGLIIDYGYEFPPKTGTLDALHRHKFVDVFTKPGMTDVTAGVDFCMLASVARRKGLVVADVTKQDSFLRKMGINVRADILRSCLQKPEKTMIDRSLDYLMNRSKMGKINVLEFFKDPTETD